MKQSEDISRKANTQKYFQVTPLFALAYPGANGKMNANLEMSFSLRGWS
jgi:hypothetical protein